MDMNPQQLVQGQRGRRFLLELLLGHLHELGAKTEIAYIWALAESHGDRIVGGGASAIIHRYLGNGKISAVLTSVVIGPIAKLSLRFSPFLWGHPRRYGAYRPAQDKGVEVSYENMSTPSHASIDSPATRVTKNPLAGLSFSADTFSVDDLNSAMQVSVDTARYLQAPDSFDRVCLEPQILETLNSLAKALWDHPVITRWSTAYDSRDLHFVCSDNMGLRREKIQQGLSMQDLKGTLHSKDHWWSAPPYPALVTSGYSTLPYPSLLSWQEDEVDSSLKHTRRIKVLKSARVFEIKTATDWLELCTRFPQPVSNHLHSQWKATTGLSRDWVIPQWHLVSYEYDAICMSPLAYLALAGEPFDMEDGETPGSATMIAGFGPGETVWLTNAFLPVETTVTWVKNANSETYS